MSEHKYIQLEEVKLHYMEAGEGKPIILLHGFPEFWMGWRKQIPELSKQFRVIAPDMRGYHLSSKPSHVNDYRIANLAKDINQLIGALGYEKAFVVGHDWGAVVAWALSSFYPEVVEKVCVINVPHPSEMSRAFLRFNLAQWIRSWYIFFFQLPYLPEKVVGTEKFFRKTFASLSTNSTAFTEEDVKEYTKAYSDPETVRATIAYYRAAFRDIFSFNGLGRYPKVKAPLMMLWGEKDKALGKELTIRTFVYCENGCKVFYEPGSGHFVQRDNPEWVNRHLIDWFS